MKIKICKYRLSKSLAVLTAVSMMGAYLSLGTSALITVPTTPIITDDSVIKVDGAGATGVMLEMLGGNLVGADAVHLSTSSMPLFMPVFGTANNSIPDPYLYNAFYNTTAEEGKKVSNTSQLAYQSPNGPGQLITTAGTDGVVPALVFRPDFIVGGLDTMDTLQACIDAVPKEENYEPVIGIGAGMANPEQIMATIQSYAADMQSVVDASGGTIKGRYGDPVDVANNFCDFYTRVMDYCDEKVTELGKEKVDVINITGISNGEWAVQSAEASDIFNRYIEKAGGNSIGQTDLIMTTAELLDADVLIAANNSVKVAMETAFDDEGYSLSEIPSIYVIPRGVYGWQLRAPEGALTVPWLTSIFYPELAMNNEINPVYTTAYFYHEYYHYNGNLEEIVGIVLTPNTLLNSLSVDLSNWDLSIVPGVDPEESETTVSETITSEEETTITASETTDTSDTTSEEFAPLYGDVNLDKVVNISDVIKYNKFLVKSITFNAEQKINADCNNDSATNISDNFMIVQYLCKIIDKLGS